MRKDELLYLHQLLALLRADFERRDVAAPEAVAAYEGVDVTPMAIYAGKDDHERAVRALAAALAASVSGDDREQVVPSA